MPFYDLTEMSNAEATAGSLTLPTQDWSAWVLRQADEHVAGYLTKGEYLAMRSLASLIAMGITEPSLKEIGDGAVPKVSKATVSRATHKSQRRGLLSVKENYATVHGMPRRQTSTYTLLLPTTPVIVKEKTQRIRREPQAEVASKVIPYTSTLVLGPVDKMRRVDKFAQSEIRVSRKDAQKTKALMEERHAAWAKEWQMKHSHWVVGGPQRSHLQSRAV